MQPIKVTKKQVGLIVAGLVVVIGAMTASQNLSTSRLGKGNLIALIGQLNQTTGQVLSGTEQLHAKVQSVSAQLAQLDTESQVLQEQLQTGADLKAQLQKQVALTQNGVSLMQQILVRQTHTEQATEQIAAKSTALQATVAASANSLQDLSSAVGQSLQTSESLQSKMGPLQQEMSNSEQEFKIFGQLKKAVPILG